VFLYNRVTGQGLHETEADEAALRAAAREKKTILKQHGSLLTSEELKKRDEEAAWRDTLKRARRPKKVHETHGYPIKDFARSKRAAAKACRSSALYQSILASYVHEHGMDIIVERMVLVESMLPEQE
jgi:hypothetical protein